MMRHMMRACSHESSVQIAWWDVMGIISRQSRETLKKKPWPAGTHDEIIIIISIRYASAAWAYRKVYVRTLPPTFSAVTLAPSHAPSDATQTAATRTSCVRPANSTPWSSKPRHTMGNQASCCHERGTANTGNGVASSMVPTKSSYIPYRFLPNFEKLQNIQWFWRIS